jgi:hypothetical protein
MSGRPLFEKWRRARGGKLRGATRYSSRTGNLTVMQTTKRDERNPSPVAKNGLAQPRQGRCARRSEPGSVKRSMRWSLGFARRIAPVWGLVVIAACTSTPVTPHGSSLMKAVFTTAQGGPPAGLTGEPQRYRHVLPVNPDRVADVKVILDVVRDPATGGQYLYRVEVLADRNGGGALAATLPVGAMPANMGSVESPVASHLLLVEWVEDRGCRGRRMGQTALVLGGDGSVVAR